MGALSPRIMQSGLEADPSPPCSPETKNERKYFTLCIPVWLGQGQINLYLYLLNAIEMVFVLIHFREIFVYLFTVRLRGITSQSIQDHSLRIVSGSHASHHWQRIW